MSTYIWSRPERPERGAGLNRERIVAAAMAIADADGLDAVTMRRVAAEIGVSTMALYRHVENKADILDLMLDAAYGELRLAPAPADGWRASMDRLAREVRAMVLRHPWFATLAHTRPPSPNYVAFYDHCLGALKGLPLSPVRLHAAVNMVVNHAVTFAQMEHTISVQWKDLGAAEREAAQSIGAYLGTLMASGRYPHFTAAMGTARPAPDEMFAMGLDLILTGIAASAS
ncbi:TetR/AcrR family transcriptional regulator [Bailinhaonella thermotolerans]|uniref:TetR/AcrR family transcriptional regulator n=1 Tax=Bailinhaonella thermotolerans TaxID=1070861 RepID=UPI00192A37E1|nr:TetR/AcrR family transcriptional regulator C-terminal domain-containing protein [Bailinhaonella thermotolerans]